MSPGSNILPVRSTVSMPSRIAFGLIDFMIPFSIRRLAGEINFPVLTSKYESALINLDCA